MDAAKAVANANSKVLLVGHFVEARHLDSRDQMAHIAAIVDDWRAETGGRPRSRIEYPGRPTRDTAQRLGGLGEPQPVCHCDGPPHAWSPGWCPSTGPVTR